MDWFAGYKRRSIEPDISISGSLQPNGPNVKTCIGGNLTFSCSRETSDINCTLALNHTTLQEVPEESKFNMSSVQIDNFNTVFNLENISKYYENANFYCACSQYIVGVDSFQLANLKLYSKVLIKITCFIILCVFFPWHFSAYLSNIVELKDHMSIAKNYSVDITWTSQAKLF